jgi:hypothetical protein
LFAQLGETGVHNALPAASAGAGDVGGQVVDEQAFRGRASGQTAAMLEETGIGLTDADLVG